MKTKTDIYPYFLFLFLCITTTINAQITPGSYFSVTDNTVHELKISGRYFILTTYEKSPANFLKTVGGYFQVQDQHLEVSLEFNSNYAKDSVRQLHIPFEKDGNKLILGMKSGLQFEPSTTISQDLDGQWLFGIRGPDKGQERRGDSKPRKTLKLLIDGRFQWIAYNTETMQFHGTGGGSFTSKDGVYQENIAYFSRDNSRVGAELTFEYKINGNDWHHKGMNSKGEPMYEIWMARNQ